jgi:hypothetical protein
MMNATRTAILWLATTHSALACAVCGGGGPNQQAFIDTMIVMSLFPLAMMGGFVGFLWWRNKQLNELPQRRPFEIDLQEG